MENKPRVSRYIVVLYGSLMAVVVGIGVFVSFHGGYYYVPGLRRAFMAITKFSNGGPHGDGGREIHNYP